MNNVFNDYMQIFGFAEGFATQFSAELWREQHHVTNAPKFYPTNPAKPGTAIKEEL
jgi:hypothetical protein